MPESNNNYTRALLTSETTVLSGMMSVLFGLILSLSHGPKMILLPPLLFFGILVAALMVVPDMPSYRRTVDQKVRKATREKTRDGLSRSINQYWPVNLDNQTRDAYQRMQQRLQDLRRLAADPKTSITEDDLDKLDDVTVDYLRLMHAKLVVSARRVTPTNDIVERIADLEHELENTQNPVDRSNIASVKADLERTLNERSRLPAKEAAIGARLLAMSEAFEELYHRASTDPTSNVSEYLADANARLSVEEELSVPFVDVDSRPRRTPQAQRS